MSHESIHVVDGQKTPISKELARVALNVTSPSPSPLAASRFSKSEKWFIVVFVAFVGLFSPLTSGIYYPAIPTLANAFDKSIELINLSVTMYMIFQGIAPMGWGPLSDHIGRRPVSAACLLVLSLSCVGLALVPTNAFWLLMLLRCLQAAGSASTIAVGAGVVGDISSRAERGGFYGIFVVGPMVGPALGPVIGGALTGSLGWRSIFWFLAVAASTCFTIIILFQPETLRRLVDSGRDTTPILHKPVVPIIGRRLPVNVTIPIPQPRASRNPFRIFLNIDVNILLVANGLSAAVFNGVLASMSPLFVRYYPFLSETNIGLCFLGIGGGMTIGSAVMGKILDCEYQTFKERIEMRSKKEGFTDTEEDFPIEKVRLRLMPVYGVILAACCAGYGFALEREANLAVPLVLQFLIGFFSIGLLNTTSTLMIDLLPGQSSAVSACCNLVRWTLAAIMVSTIDIILRAVGTGWTFVLYCGIVLLMMPLIFLSMRLGPSYRRKRHPM